MSRLGRVIFNTVEWRRCHVNRIDKMHPNLPPALHAVLDENVQVLVWFMVCFMAWH